MKSSTPIWLSSCRIGIDAAGNRNALVAGATQPTSEGPSSTPAAISPMTGGCPTRLASAPIARAASMMTISWRSSRASGCCTLADICARGPADGPAARIPGRPDGGYHIVPSWISPATASSAATRANA